MTEEGAAGDLIFTIQTPLGFVVRCTRSYWEFISSEKHPTVAGRMEEVKQALADPDEIRRSRKDRAVMLFYPRTVTALVMCGRPPRGRIRVLDHCLSTHAIKAGEQIWTRSG